MKYKVKFRVNATNGKKAKYSINIEEGADFVMQAGALGLDPSMAAASEVICILKVLCGEVFAYPDLQSKTLKHNNRMLKECRIRPGDFIEKSQLSVEFLEVPVIEQDENVSTRFLDISDQKALLNTSASPVSPSPKPAAETPKTQMQQPSKRALRKQRKEERKKEEQAAAIAAAALEAAQKSAKEVEKQAQIASQDKKATQLDDQEDLELSSIDEDLDDDHEFENHDHTSSLQDLSDEDESPEASVRPPASARSIQSIKPSDSKASAQGSEHKNTQTHSKSISQPVKNTQSISKSIVHSQQHLPVLVKEKNASLTLYWKKQGRLFSTVGTSLVALFLGAFFTLRSGGDKTAADLKEPAREPSFQSNSQSLAPTQAQVKVLNAPPKEVAVAPVQQQAQNPESKAVTQSIRAASIVREDLSDLTRGSRDQFFAAIKSGDLKSVREMIESRTVDANFTLERGATPLMVASARGHLATVKYFVSLRVSLDARDPEGTTALMWAVHRGQLEVAQYLIRSGADVGIYRDDGDRAIDIARRWNQVELVKLLKKAEAGRDLAGQRHHSQGKKRSR